ncbi:MAG: hypothetical protein CVU67_03090, partial [Deltaproteobacteria bacterium HGW-Deltaproteobacteria-24]
MAVDNVQVNTVVDASGNTYTSAVSNDKLTNSDFLKLMLEELKLQDPTKPMDSSQMMQNQTWRKLVQPFSSRRILSSLCPGLQRARQPAGVAMGGRGVGVGVGLTQPFTSKPVGS